MESTESKEDLSPPCKKFKSDDSSTKGTEDDIGQGDDSLAEVNRSMESAGGCESGETRVSNKGEIKLPEEGEFKPAAERQLVLREIDVGITEYISDHQGFLGVIKQRYSDFLVNEVDDKGDVVILTDISSPLCDQQTASSSDVAAADTVLSEDQLVQLNALKESQANETVVTIPVGADKDQRSKVHQAIRNRFPGMESTTVDGATDGAKVIQVRLSSHKNTKGRRSNERWSRDCGDYCRFIMYKENKHTMEAVNLLAKLLRIKPGAITYAGTKDKRGKTSQLLSTYRVTASRLHALNKTLRGITLGNFRYYKTPLKLGDLKGNRFSIALRNVSGNESDISSAMESLQNTGFINYFGMQRFGTTSVPTHHVGRALLKSRWQEAIDLILQPRKEDLPELVHARRLWQKNKDAEGALKHLHRYHGAEKQLLQGLAKCNPGDLVNALSSIPRHMRSMYVHAYQSYIWNSVVSRRLGEFGYKPVIGDLILPDKDSDLSSLEEDTVERCWPTPLVVTEENISQYSIHQVVLPLPGHNILLPENEAKDWYTDLLAQDGMTIADFRHRLKDYSLPGGYRFIITQPTAMTWRSLTYSDSTVSLLMSDLDLLNGCSLEDQDGSMQALVVTFNLPPSAYATMALREILKQDTSAAHQTTLNPT